MLEEQNKKNRDDISSPRNMLSNYFGMIEKSSAEESGKKFSNYLKGSSNIKGDKVILAG
jgi:hypothetical protein